MFHFDDPWKRQTTRDMFSGEIETEYWLEID